jgi:outer membrane scaffolding protein for murein synthesis (MipA/OmpV family)
MVILATLERISKVNDDIFKATTASRRLLYLVVVLWACVPRAAWSQTPSPLQEWQYSSGIALEKLFEPNLPDWDVVLGAGGEYKPLYDGAELTRKQAGPVINVRYKDIAFASVGEGLGINLIHGKHYRGGIALGYDLGRLVSNDVGHLHGLGDIGRAPDVKVFASYVLSKSFPLVVRGDVRQIVGGADGMLADLGAYLPIPASSKRLIVLVGPSYTYADHRYMQKVFGVTATQSIASRYPVYDAHAGSDAVGFGFSATGFFTDHWLINMDAAVNRLLGSARESPITQKTTQHALGLSVAYSW